MDREIVRRVKTAANPIEEHIEQDLHGRNADSLSNEEKKALLEFIIAKAAAFRDFVSIVATPLSSIDYKNPDAARKAFVTLTSSKEYLELRARCVRLDQLAHHQRFRGFWMMFGEHPAWVANTLSGSLKRVESVESTASNKRTSARHVAGRVYSYGPRLSPTELTEIELNARQLAEKWGFSLKSESEITRELGARIEAISQLEAQARDTLGGPIGVLSDKAAVARDVLRKSAWFSGSFYLTVFISIISIISIAQAYVSAWAFPMILIGGIVSTTVVGALQLKNDGRLSEENFLTLIQLSFGRLTILLQFWRKTASSGDVSGAQKS